MADFILMDKAELDAEELFCLEIWAALIAKELEIAIPELQFFRPAVTKADCSKPKLPQKPHGQVLGFVTRKENIVFLRGNLSYKKMQNTLFHEMSHLKQHTVFSVDWILSTGLGEGEVYNKFRKLMEYYADDYAKQKLEG